MKNILKNWISLENYERLEKFAKKFSTSDINYCLVIDDEDRINNNKRALENYLSHQVGDISFTIIDISSLPKDTSICLVMRKHEPK
jgi:hypothetical protein